jgi:hypothetical protein
MKSVKVVFMVLLGLFCMRFIIDFVIRLFEHIGIGKGMALFICFALCLIWAWVNKRVFI